MVTILKGIGHLYIFGILGSHVLVLIMFEGASNAPSIFPVEVPQVTYAGFLVNNYSAPKRYNRGGNIIKSYI